LRGRPKTRKEKKKAGVEDAMPPLVRRFEEGIVDGGGSACLRCITAIEKLK